MKYTWESEKKGKNSAKVGDVHMSNFDGEKLQAADKLTAWKVVLVGKSFFRGDEEAQNSCGYGWVTPFTMEVER